MNKYTIEQSGRSMIEMLGVLAIVGVLSVAGIAGYSKAMAKYKANKVIDQISMTAANVRTAFSGQGSFSGLDPSVAYGLGVFPDDVAKACDIAGTFTDGCAKNAMGGSFAISVTGGDNYSFNLGVNQLSREACATLVASDWGSAAAFVGLSTAGNIEDDALGEKVYSLKKPDVTVKELQEFAASAATKLCDCGTANECSLIWTFK